MRTDASPLILSCTWGRVEVDGFGVFKDALLLPGLAKEWRWEKPFNSHASANSVPLVEALMASGAETVIMTLGMDGVLKMPSDTLHAAAPLGPNLFIARSDKAVQRYNELVHMGRTVAMALHSTC